MCSVQRAWLLWSLGPTMCIKTHLPADCRIASAGSCIWEFIAPASTRPQLLPRACASCDKLSGPSFLPVASVDFSLLAAHVLWRLRHGR